MKQYKAIFLDWDDTIGDFRSAAYQSLQDIYSGYNLSNCYDSFEQFYTLYTTHNVYLWELYGQEVITKSYLEFDRFFFPLMMALRPCGVDECVRLAQLAGKEHLNHTTSYFRPLQGAPEVVRYLASKYPLTIVSNGFVEVQYKKIQLSGLQDCFSHVILSEEVGCQKPNKRIFEIALSRNGLHPEEVLMIGDSWTSDIQGAINAGIDQAWIQDPAHTSDPSLPATYKVGKLTELMYML